MSNSENSRPGYRSLDFWFQQTDEFLRSAWISESCTIYDFIDCARSLGYLREDCRFARIGVIHRSEYLDGDRQLSSINVHPGEVLTVLSGPDVSLTNVRTLIDSDLSLDLTVQLLRYTSDRLDEALRVLRDMDSGTHPRETRDRLLRDPGSLRGIVSKMGCYDRKATEHFLGSLLLNPACFEREIASITFGRAHGGYSRGYFSYAFTHLLRIYKEGMPGGEIDERLLLSNDDRSLARGMYAQGKSKLMCMGATDASLVLRRSADFGLWTSFVLYALCLEFDNEPADGPEIRRYLNMAEVEIDCAKDRHLYVRSVYGSLRHKHHKDGSDYEEGVRGDTFHHREWISLVCNGLHAKNGRVTEIESWLGIAEANGIPEARSIRMFLSFPDTFASGIRSILSEAYDRIIKCYEQKQMNTWRASKDNIVRACLDLALWSLPEYENDAEAQYVRGLCLLIGYGTYVNYDQAIWYFRYSAQTGNAGGEWMYGRSLLKEAEGFGVTKDEKEAVRYLKRSADQGFGPGENEYGLCLWNGETVSEDEGEAGRYLKRSADHGWTEGQLNYGLWLMEKDRSGERREEARQYMKMSADNGCPRAQYIYGAELVDEPQSLPPSPEAIRYIKMSADLGYDIAQCYYGLCLRCLGDERNYQEAFKYFKLSAAQGNVEAQFHYGMCYFDGVGVDRNQEVAVQYIKRSADQGNAEAQYHFAQFCYQGIGGPPDLTTAAQYFKKSADQGWTEGQLMYGLCLMEKDSSGERREEARQYIKMSADNGCPRAQYIYGTQLLDELQPLPPSPEAIRYIKMSADLGYDIAQCRYGWLCLRGLGVERNYQEAFKYFKLSASQGNMEAQFHYGMCLFHGVGVDRNQEVAVQYIKRSADQGHVEAQYNFAQFCYQGIGGPPDLTTAAQYFKKSADQGFAAAQHNYGMLLAQGIGVAQDTREALRYLQLSRDQGYFGPQ